MVKRQKILKILRQRLVNPSQHTASFPSSINTKHTSHVLNETKCIGAQRRLIKMVKQLMGFGDSVILLLEKRNAFLTGLLEKVMFNFSLVPFLTVYRCIISKSTAAVCEKI